MRSRVLSATIGTPVAPGQPVAMPDGGITDALSAHFGSPVCLGVHLGPPRANRKPVLSVTSVDGRLLGFCKVGIDELTDRLVRTEASALQALSGMVEPTTPRLLLSSTWGGHPMIVQSPVRGNGRLIHDRGQVARAQVAVSRITPADTSKVDYLSRLQERFQRATEVSGANRWSRLLAETQASIGLQQIPYGSWHGDWRATNMTTTSTGVSVWDWERFEANVPVGFDALHLCLTTMAPKTDDTGQLVPAVFRRASSLLQPFGLQDPVLVDAVTTLYFLELAARYLEDRQRSTGARLGDVSTWMLPQLELRRASSR